MAEKTSEAKGLERIYTIPLRRGWLKEPRSKRSNRALREIERFLKKHTKANKIKFSKGLNELIFSRGFKKPPGKVKVEVKGDFETIQAKIPGEVIEKKEEKKTGVAGGVAGLKERLMKKEGEEKKEELKNKVEEKAMEATSEERIKETVEGVKKEEDKRKAFKEKKEKK